MMLRLLTLLAVMLMPFAMAPAGAANAYDWKPSAATSMPHCPEQMPSHDSKGTVGGCAMACSAALPAVDLTRPQPLPVSRAAATISSGSMLFDRHPEIATPPPRSS